MTSPPSKPRVLLVDLNNFASYPTLAIGMLVSTLRQSGMEVEVLCPLSHDVPADLREKQEGWRDHWKRRVFFGTHPAYDWARLRVRKLRSWYISRPHARVLSEFDRALANKPDIVLLSAYLNHYPSCVEIGKRAKAAGVPVLLGGPAFNIPEITKEWLDVPGVTAIVGAETEFTLPQIVQDTLAGKDLLQHKGVWMPNGSCSAESEPNNRLSDVPIPDFSDFPWSKYRERVIPIMATRGCQWAKCTFCSDVQMANGRTFRTRSVESLLTEMETLADRHETKNFILLDIKLNSDVALWRGLIEQVQDRIPGARWVGTVHVDLRKDNGLTAKDLKAAQESGMMRINFGLETASRRILERMRKGTDPERTSQFIHEAHDAGLSVRTTMMQGYPGEEATDLDESVAYLDQHDGKLDRIRLSQFKALPATDFHRDFEQNPQRYAELADFEWDFRDSRAAYRYTKASARKYRKSKLRLLNKVYEVNRRPLRAGAEAFDGLM